MTKIILGYSLSHLKPARASAVPYVVKKTRSRRGIEHTTVHFLFGIDRKSGDLTDFGGGVRKNENALIAALREFKEETNGIFDGDVYDTPNRYISSISVTNKVLSTLFVPVDESHLYMDVTTSSPEIKEFVWLTQDNLKKLLTGRCHKKIMMWGRLRSFYRSINIDDLCRTLICMDTYHC